MVFKNLYMKLIICKILSGYLNKKTTERRIFNLENQHFYIIYNKKIFKRSQSDILHFLNRKDWQGGPGELSVETIQQNYRLAINYLLTIGKAINFHTLRFVYNNASMGLKGALCGLTSHKGRRERFTLSGDAMSAIAHAPDAVKRSRTARDFLTRQ